MSEMIDDDPGLRQRLNAWVGWSIHGRDPGIVASNAIAQAGRSRSWRFGIPGPVTAIALVLVIVGGSVGMWAIGASGDASRLTGATVNGLTYTVAVARSLTVKPDVLRAYAAFTNLQTFAKPDEGMTYAIDGIDPDLALVVKLKPGQADDAGPIGDYLLLVRGENTFSLLCPYFDVTAAATPAVCR